MLKYVLLVLAAVASTIVSDAAFAQVREETTIAPNRPRIVARGTEPEVRWIGVAVSRQGRVFTVRDQGFENPARSDALNGCEQRAGSSCRAIAVPESWDVVAVACSRLGMTSDSFVGGSTESYDTAERIALNKARDVGFGDQNCRRVFAY